MRKSIRVNAVIVIISFVFMVITFSLSGVPYQYMLENYLNWTPFQSSSLAFFIGCLMVLVAQFLAQYKRAQLKSSTENIKDVKRVEFSKDTKDFVKKRQNGRCAICGEFPNHWEFDHIGSRGDNSIGNCQGLCLDCHQDKTERERYSKL